MSDELPRQNFSAARVAVRGLPGPAPVNATADFTDETVLSNWDACTGEITKMLKELNDRREGCWFWRLGIVEDEKAKGSPGYIRPTEFNVRTTHSCNFTYKSTICSI